MKEFETNWIYAYERVPRIEDNGSSRVLVNWVNLKFDHPFFGTDIIDCDEDFDSYLKNTGRIIFRWSEFEAPSIIIPDEVVDKDTLFEYIKFLREL